MKTDPDVFDLCIMDARIHPDKEGPFHDDIGIGQLANYPVVDVHKSRLAQQVPAEQVARLDPVGFQKTGQLVPGKSGAITLQSAQTQTRQDQSSGWGVAAPAYPGKVRVAGRSSGNWTCVG